MKVLVTGATGFLGKYIIDELVENNYKVVAFGRNEKIGKSLENENVRFFKGDFTEKEDIIKVINSQKSPESKINADLNHENQTKSDLKVSRKYHTEEISAVIHAGGLSTVWGKWQDFYNSNVKGTENILEICRIYKIKKLIFISSPSIYAEPKDQVNVREEEAPEENNLNFYIKSKIMAEKKIKEYADIPSVIIRPRGLFGVGDTSVIPRLLKLNRAKGIPLFNDGKQMVDVTCVENAAFAIRLALESENSSGQIYNITNNEPMAFKNILELFFKEFGEKPHFIRKNYNTVKFFVNVIEKIYHLFGITKEPPITMYTLYLMRYSQTLNIQKAEKELNYKPKLTIAEGVKKYVENNRKIDYFSCGYCTNDMQKIFKGVCSGKRNFHAGVFLIKHKTRGYILYDTGYSMKIFENKLEYKIYTGLNPVTLKKEDIINEQLKKEGIGTEKINYIILSHLHPDHIGGAEFFPDAQIIITDEYFQEYKKSSFKSLIFKEILPENFEERLKIIEINSHNSAFPYIKSHDLFNDGSLFLSRIDGHAKGQGCLFIPEKNLFLAADVCWGIDLLELTDKIKFIPRLIQNNFSEYKKRCRNIEKLMKNNIDVIVSHDMPERIRGILNEKDS